MKVICIERDILQIQDHEDALSKIVPDAEVSYFTYPVDAVQAAESTGCDVLVTGIDMGASPTEGLELARRFKQINPRVNIIFLTVCSEWEHIHEVLRLRISGYVTKPYELQDLEAEFADLRYAVG